MTSVQKMHNLHARVVCELCKDMARVARIERAISVLETDVLPLHYTD